MPNFYYMFVQFIHLLALAVWVGGGIIIAAIVAPTVFGKLDSRTQSGQVVGEILKKFDSIIYICIFALAVTSVIKYNIWENFNPFIAIRYSAITLMSLSAIYSSRIVSPKLHALKKKIKIFEELPKDNVNRLEFKKLHQISAGCLVFSLFCGLICILLA